MLPTGLTVNQTVRAKILLRPVIGQQPAVIVCDHTTEEVTTGQPVEGPVVTPTVVVEPSTRKKFTVQEKLAIAQSFQARTGSASDRYILVCQEYKCSMTMVKESVKNRKQLQEQVNHGLGALCRVRKPQLNIEIYTQAKSFLVSVREVHGGVTKRPQVLIFF